MTAPAFYRSPDAEPPLCTSCAWSTIPWPPTFDDVTGDDRCGAGVRTMGRTTRQCFSYRGERGELVTFEVAKEAPAVGWQERADGMRIRKPKES